MSYNRSALTKS